jgi:metal-dependent amidase/aminoacylase/carboxypeptidase family protein
MIDDGLFDGIDAALLYHPSDRTFVETALMACDDIDVTFTGQPAHAAAEPWRGRNALDAMVMLLNSIALWRQQLRPDARVHGIVLEGGTAANIIPARAVGRFMVRSRSQTDFEAMEERFGDLVRAAAAATGCEGEAVFSGRSSTMRHNPVLGELFAANLVANGLVEDPPDDLGSSDIGNVSHLLPTIHPAIAICERGVPMHSVEFREAAASPAADDVVIASATVVAQTAYDLFADPTRVEAAWQAFRRRG